MLHIKFISTLGIVLALLGLITTAIPAYADGSFSVEASGFNKNEHVATWVALSDGTTVALGQVTADENGNVALPLGEGVYFENHE